MTLTGFLSGPAGLAFPGGWARDVDHYTVLMYSLKCTDTTQHVCSTVFESRQRNAIRDMRISEIKDVYEVNASN